MRDKRTSKKQSIVYDCFKKYLERKILNKGGYTESNDDTFIAHTNKTKIKLELEKRIPETRYSSDILMTIYNKSLGITKIIAIEYDGLHWHRKWTDEKKNKALNDKDINIIRIQTFARYPKPETLWQYVKDIFKSDETQTVYYRLPDFDDDVWTGKRFLHYLDGR